MPPTDLGAVRLARVLAALEDVQRWAENEAEAPAEGPEGDRSRGRAEGYAAAAERIGALRAELDVTRPDAASVLAEAHGGASVAFAAVLEHVRTLDEWARDEAARAEGERGAEVEADELRAAGRADALDGVASELRSVLRAAPSGTA